MKKQEKEQLPETPMRWTQVTWSLSMTKSMKKNEIDTLYKFIRNSGNRFFLFLRINQQQNLNHVARASSTWELLLKYFCTENGLVQLKNGGLLDEITQKWKDSQSAAKVSITIFWTVF